MTEFRVAITKDVKAITKLVVESDLQMTTLPRSREQVIEYIERTSAFLEGDESANFILFVIQKNEQIIGVSAIISTLGKEQPFYSFRMSSLRRHTKQPAISSNLRTLQLSTYFNDFTELASLYIAPQYRGAGLARLLSLGRLAFICRHRGYFDEKIMADIRGWADGFNRSPFWENVISKFIPMEFDEADHLSTVDNSFIQTLLPQSPLFIDLFKEGAAAHLGRPHKMSKGAYGLLESIGFRWEGACDVFDAGPSIECNINDTHIARTTRIVQLCSSVNLGKPALLFTGEKASFTATLGIMNTETRKAQAVTADRELLLKTAPIYAAEIERAEHRASLSNSERII